MSKACIDRSDSLIFQHKRRPRGIGFTYASSEVQMSVRELRHDRPVVFKIPGFACKRFLPFFPTPSTLLYLRHFSRSLTLVPRSLLLNRTETLATQARIVLPLARAFLA